MESARNSISDGPVRVAHEKLRQMNKFNGSIPDYLLESA